MVRMELGKYLRLDDELTSIIGERERMPENDTSYEEGIPQTLVS